MKVYIVRHGQSQGNLLKLHQGMETPLTETGMKQAEFVGERFKSIPVEIIFASDMLRTKQTAEIITKAIHKKIEFSPLIRENMLPGELAYKPESDPEAEAMIAILKKNIHDNNFRHPGAENFEDFKGRVFKFMKQLEKRSEENILVVTHGYPMRIMMGYAIFGEDFSSYDYVKLRDRLEAKNTGITVCSYQPDKGWKLLTFNDHAHLGEI